MSKKKYRRKPRRSFPTLAVVIGLVLVGFAILAMALPRTTANLEGRNSIVPAKVNYAAPELSLQNIHGETRSLADYRHNVLLVNNWATWCPPCKAEMPTLSAYFNEHHDDGFMIIAIEAGDAVDGVSQFAENYGLKFQVWLDPGNASLKAFGNGSLPNSYVIDRAGMVRYAWTGEVNKATLEKYVTPLLAENY